MTFEMLTCLLFVLTLGKLAHLEISRDLSENPYGGATNSSWMFAEKKIEPA